MRRPWLRSRHRLPALVAAAVTLVLQVGCWDYHPVTTRAFVLGMAIDRAPEGGYVVTVEVPQPSRMKASGGGATAGGGGDSTTAFYLHQETGPTLADALEKIQSRMDRALFFGHMRTIVFGEDLAADGLKPITEELVRWPQIDKLSWPMVARGTKPEEFLTIMNHQEKAPALFLSKVFDNARIQDMTIPVTLFEFFIRGWEPGFFEGLPTVEMAPGTTPSGGARPGLGTIVQGFALFNDWKMVGWLSPEETRDLLFLRGKAAHISLSLPRESQGEYDEVRDLSGRVRIKPIIDPGGRVRFVIDVRVTGNVAEVAGRQMKLTSADIFGLQRETEGFLQERLRATMEHLKESGADELGLGSRLFYEDPKVWEKLDWDKYYPTVPVEIRVRVRLRRKGLTT